MQMKWDVRLVALSAVLSLPIAAAVDQPAMKLYRPSNTGIPGEEIRFLKFAPDGKPWIGARWPFWQEGGVGIYDFATDTWSDYINHETAIPSEYVNDIEFGPDGAVWIATDGGLVRKVGDAWTVYTTANSPLLTNSVRNIALDSQGRVWVNNTDVTNQNAALFRFDGTSWTKYAVPTELPWADPWRQLAAVHVDANDHVWVTNMTLQGVAEFNGTIWTIHGKQKDVFGSVTSDHQGNIWLISGGLGYTVYKFNGTLFIPWGGGTPPLAMTTNTVVTVAPDGAVYVGNWYGQIARTYDGGAHWSFFAQISDITIGITFRNDGSGEVWAGSLGAVHRLSSSGAPLHVYNTYNTGCGDFFVEYMSADRMGNFWLGAGESGLSRFDGQRWRNWGNHNAGSEPYPFAGNEPMGMTYIDRNGVGWMGGNGIARWDPLSGAFSGFWNWQNNPNMGVTLFPWFAEDMNGALFAADEYGSTFRFNPAQQLWIREPIQPYAVMGLPGMQADRHGNVWLAAWFSLFKWDGATWTEIGTDWPLFDWGGINSFAVAPDDTIWMATVKGLAHWDGASIALYDSHNTPMEGDLVSGVAVRADGLVGVAAYVSTSVTPWPSGAGVFKGDPTNPDNWQMAAWGSSPLPHYQLGRVAFDAAGNLWVSAISEGVAVLQTAGSFVLPGDLDGNGPVDLNDLATLLGAYGRCSGEPGYLPAADLDATGCVELGDLAIALSNYGI